MPLKLNVGVSRKVGLPGYSSIGASCNVESELDSSLLENDLDRFHAQVRDAFVAAHQAVNDELDRLQDHLPVQLNGHPVATNSDNYRNGAETRANGSTRRTTGVPARNNDAGWHRPRPATSSQVKAIYAIARDQNIALEGLLRQEFGVGRPEDLSLPDASRLIDTLKGAAV
jgi:hypothetical protein